MLTPNPSAKIVLAAYISGAVGAIGQSYLLFHELSMTLPYKVVDARAYASIGEVGLWVASISAIFLSAAIARRSIVGPVLFPVGLAPAMFALAFRFLSRLYPPDRAHEVLGGEFTVANAADQFYAYAGVLAVVGLIVAALIALGLKAIQSVKGLP